MYVSSAQKRIVGAVVAGSAIIAGALILRTDSAPTTRLAIETVKGEPVIVTTAGRREAIPIADSNGDGVPDWQEALQKTEPIAATATSTPFLAPSTLTDTFALEFFEQMVRSQNYGEFGKNPDELVQTFSTQLASEVQDTPITRAHINVIDNNTPAALSVYGENVALIMNNSGSSNENEAVILERALRDNDVKELQKLDAKIAAYQALLNETMRLPVPSSVVLEHLALLNAYQAILIDINAMRGAFNDPMLTLLRIKRYQDDAGGLANVITALYTKLLSANVSWPPTSAVYTIINVAP